MDPFEIEVSQRPTDYWTDETGKIRPKYHACLKGKSGVWAVGKSVDEAVGNLICSAQKEFRIKIIEK